MSNGFIKMIRSDAMLELAKTPNAAALLMVIAIRARYREGYNQHGLQLGEALVGDYENYGLTEQKYRTAKKVLFSTGKVTFKATSKGTIAKLVDNSFYDINIEGQQRTEQRTEQRASNEQATSGQRLTKKERKKEVKKTTGFSDSSSFKAKLFPIPGKNCQCGMPAVYTDTSGSYDHHYCQEHMPDKVKAVYGAV